MKERQSLKKIVINPWNDSKKINNKYFRNVIAQPELLIKIKMTVLK